MAIAFDATSGIYQSSTVTSQDLSHTCTGTNRVLIVATRTYDGDGVSGVTYNGAAMTVVSTVVTGTDRLKTWRLINPSSGANVVTATISPARRIEIYAVSLTGADQTTQPDVAGTTNTGSSASATGSVTTSSDNAWSVAAVALNGASGTITSGTNCTAGATTTDRGGIGYGGPKTPAGSFTQALTIGGSGAWAFAQVAIRPSTAVGPTTVKTFDGVTQSSGIKTYFEATLAQTKSVIGAT